jgi:hypothetical protein
MQAIGRMVRVSVAQLQSVLQSMFVRRHVNLVADVDAMYRECRYSVAQCAPDILGHYMLQALIGEPLQVEAGQVVLPRADLPETVGPHLCPHGIPRSDRNLPLTWSPLTESNRRPSPYHKHGSPPQVPLPALTASLVCSGRPECPQFHRHPVHDPFHGQHRKGVTPGNRTGRWAPRVRGDTTAAPDTLRCRLRRSAGGGEGVDLLQRVAEPVFLDLQVMAGLQVDPEPLGGAEEPGQPQRSAVPRRCAGAAWRCPRRPVHQAHDPSGQLVPRRTPKCQLLTSSADSWHANSRARCRQ